MVLITLLRKQFKKKSNKKILKKTVRYIFFITGDLEKDIFFFYIGKLIKWLYCFNYILGKEGEMNN